VFSDLEISRAKQESRLTDVLSLPAVERSAREWLGKRSASVAEQLAWLANVYHIDLFRIPENFPAWVLEGMRKLNLNYELIKGALYPKRFEKTQIEAEMVREGNRCSAAGFRLVEQILQASEIRDGFIFYQGKALTSEFLQQEIEVVCLRAGGIAQHTIVAGGDQACDPHCQGSGPLKAHELIIVDIFPRMKKHGYFGDMTRTFLKGTASEEQRLLVKTVQAAHKLGLSLVSGGAKASDIHGAIVNLFEDEGFFTKKVDGVPVGFFHSTGHGLGLEIHEPIRIGANPTRLKPGYVLTVEPGLYYPGIGGCRIEDVVWVTETGRELLSKAPYDWEIA